MEKHHITSVLNPLLDSTEVLRQREKQLKLDRLYMDIAFRVAEESQAKRLKVGSILVKDGNILAMGWNGTPSGFDNQCENEHGMTKPEVMHAELNMFAKLASSYGSAKGGTVYCTDSSCMNCALLAAASKVSRLVYSRQYRDTSGIIVLQKSGIVVDHLKGE
jgi:dCMP deaminase